MRKFNVDDLRQFLEAVDGHLKRPARINIMGGGAIMLGSDVDLETSDVDTFETDLRPLRRAFEKATEETDIRVPVSDAGGAVGDWPRNSDDRLVPVLTKLKKLKVRVLEAHDVALSKMLRGYEKDFLAIERLHDAVGLSDNVLFDRYINEMDHVTGSQARHDDNFAEMIARLFGDDEGIVAAKRLRKLRG